VFGLVGYGGRLFDRYGSQSIECFIHPLFGVNAHRNQQRVIIEDGIPTDTRWAGTMDRRVANWSNTFTCTSSPVIPMSPSQVMVSGGQSSRRTTDVPPLCFLDVVSQTVH
jgi:hypothetical protein